jgi:hypothetical protein
MITCETEANGATAPVAGDQTDQALIREYPQPTRYAEKADSVILSTMTKLLEVAVAELRTLPEDEQDRAAEVILAFAHDRRDYTIDAEQIEGIRHAMIQADKGQFASGKQLRKIFGRAL